MLSQLGSASSARLVTVTRGGVLASLKVRVGDQRPALRPVSKRRSHCKISSDLIDAMRLQIDGGREEAEIFGWAEPIDGLPHKGFSVGQIVEASGQRRPVIQAKREAGDRFGVIPYRRPTLREVADVVVDGGEFAVVVAREG